MQNVNLNILRTRNVGDFICQPARYFDLDAKMLDLRDPVPESNAIIYGGGAIGPRLTKGHHRKHQSHYKVAWGVGFSNHEGDKPGPAPTDFDLFGSREFGQPGTEYVPCVSCMHDLFCLDYEIEHDVVLYYNKDPRRPRPNWKGVPTKNNEIPMDQAIAFLASGAHVVTNSYHGAYWATLLGRRVTIVDPYSSKFRNYEHQPELCEGTDWKAAKDLQGIAHPEAKAIAIRRNIDFYSKVMEIIE
jgi:hypothetical protein